MRIGNVAGADSLFAAIGRGRRVQLDRFPNGQGPRRSYIAPEDFLQVVQALIRCPLDDVPSILNVSAPKATEMQAIAEAAGCEVSWKEAPETANELVELDTSLLQRIVPLPMSCAEPERLLVSWKSRGVVK
jgi:hypothetical protein